jgi:hypothetical protein
MRNVFATKATQEGDDVRNAVLGYVLDNKKVPGRALLLPLSYNVIVMGTAVEPLQVGHDSGRFTVVNVYFPGPHVGSASGKKSSTPPTSEDDMVRGDPNLIVKTLPFVLSDRAPATNTDRDCVGVGVGVSLDESPAALVTTRSTTPSTKAVAWDVRLLNAACAPGSRVAAAVLAIFPFVAHIKADNGDRSS